MINLRKTIFISLLMTAMLMVAGLSYGQSSTTDSVLKWSAKQYTISTAGEALLVQGTFYIAYNIGEPLIFADSSLNYVLWSGFEQPLGDTIAYKKDDMTIYPNPAYTSTATAKYVMSDGTGSSGITKIDIRIVSLSGQLMFTDSKTVDVKESIFLYQFDTEKYNPGIYVVTLFMDTGIKASRKFVRVRL
ncbi:T9SS type A sorting domain-containing protein [Chitinophaga sancti]|uniref:T9SS type A sorting domain-containing protein n=2 Tax=Chitinophaga sancti TaxID=1004 RepID=A0ABZ0XL99_9BACT|nr:T9SS type A sorting domain-containing protein [Chitinophaga sancti]WQD63295.1 T9SS type A sorting domain-containing protein [Chitinophaga sancti]WQG91079.1 T9SS type A sorting domain-containing protein [Chitinophaga sancti]